MAIRFHLRTLTQPRIAFLKRVGHCLPNLVSQRFLVSLSNEDVVRLLVHDLGGRFDLAVNGVGRDDRPFQVEPVDQLLHGRDFVRLVVDRVQSQAQLQPAHPGRDRVQRRLRRRLVERSPQCFAVERHRLAFERSGDAGGPGLQGGVELHAVQPREDFAERVVRGDAPWDSATTFDAVYQVAKAKGIEAEF